MMIFMMVLKIFVITSYSIHYTKLYDTLEATRCLGCCGLAPVIMIDDQVFGRLVPSDVPDILAKFND